LVLDGASAIMLSDETAIGQYPAETVATMRRIADTASTYLQNRLDHQDVVSVESIPHATRDAIALICRKAPVTKIVAITISGYAARMVASSMPRQPILAVSNDRATARALNLLAGTQGIYVDLQFSRTSTDHIAQCLRRLWECGKLDGQDLILVTSVSYPKSGNRMNLIELHRVSDLRESLSWTR
jgi:pyruvate kinase